MVLNIKNTIKTSILMEERSASNEKYCAAIDLSSFGCICIHPILKTHTGDIGSLFFFIGTINVGALIFAFISICKVEALSCFSDNWLKSILLKEREAFSEV